MAQTKEIVGCRKTAVIKEFTGSGWVGPLDQKPPYTVREKREQILVIPPKSTFTSYKIFEIEYDKNESSEKIWTCPHCNEGVKVINKKAGARSQKELEKLSEELDKPRRKWRIILPLIFLIGLGYCIINPGERVGDNLVIFLLFSPLLGLAYIFGAMRLDKYETEQKYGFIYIEKPETHNFLVSFGSYGGALEGMDIGFESKQQPIAPASDFSHVKKIIHNG